MSVHLSDLPTGVREQLERDGKVKSKQARPSRAGVGHATPCPGVCGMCGESFDRYSRWEKHRYAEHGGGGRWSITLGAAS